MFRGKAHKVNSRALLRTVRNGRAGRGKREKEVNKVEKEHVQFQIRKGDKLKTLLKGSRRPQKGSHSGKVGNQDAGIVDVNTIPGGRSNLIGEEQYVRIMGTGTEIEKIVRRGKGSCRSSI